MPTTQTTDSSGRNVLVFAGQAKLQDFREAKAGFKSRASKWLTDDGSSVFAFVDTEKSPDLVAAIEATGPGGVAEIELIRSRKLRRKDGTAVPQVGPWEELSVFDDTVTVVSRVNNAGSPSLLPAGGNPSTSTAPLGVEPSLADKYSGENSLERFRAAVACGVPRQVLNQMAAIMILDGCDPLEVRSALLERALPRPSSRSKPKPSPPSVSTPPDIASGGEEGGSSEGPAEFSSVQQTPALSITPRVRRNNTPPPPRRAIQPLIGPEQISILQKIAVRAGCDASVLADWAMCEFRRELNAVTRAEADRVINDFRQLGPEAGLKRFRLFLGEEATDGED